MRSYFLYRTKKNCIHLRALSKYQYMQFTSIWCLVQHLPWTFTFRIMLAATVIHSPILEPTRHQLRITTSNHNLVWYISLLSCWLGGVLPRLKYLFINNPAIKHYFHGMWFKSMVKAPQYAIYKHLVYGPTFGNAWDIYISDNANSNSDSFAHLRTYEAPKESQHPTTILSGASHFSPDDWEVFYLG